MRHVNGIGQTEALTWLAENLEEVALDQEAEGYDPTSEGTPLVPISKDSIDAMEDKMFQKVLKAVGVMPPSDEQETYWRIPADLHHETIRKRREIILKAINKELIVDTNISDNETNIINTDMANDSDSNDRQNNENSNNENERNNDINTYGDDDDGKNKTNKTRKTRKRVRSAETEEQVNKLAKIDEDDEDILSFAKKTLNQEILPDTEDILSALPRRDDDSSDEDAPINISKRKKRLVVSDDESD
ncbi:unnamed protein product [Colias eurytheme]|nr:unnamed protein product [Colias eurytheme]